jgi:hypothetical protein
VALRNVATGDFVLTGQRTNNATDWQMVRFSAAQLAGLDTNAVYTLDVIDARNNAWGWFNFDSARIPAVLVYQGPALALQPWPDGSLRLAWPLSATDYRLEVSFDLDNWEDAAWWGFFPAAEGNQTVVYVTPWEAALFFRLMKP